MVLSWNSGFNRQVCVTLLRYDNVYVPYDSCIAHWKLYSYKIVTDIYIMAGRAFVVANKFFIMETVVFWQCNNG